MHLATTTIETPLGAYTLIANEFGLVRARPSDASASAPLAKPARSAAERMLARARSSLRSCAHFGPTLRRRIQSTTH